MKKTALRTIHFFAHPVTDTANVLHALKIVKCTKRTQIVIGTFIMFVGVSIAKFGASHDANVIATVAVDAFGYTIHAFGAVPLVKVLAEALGIEA